MDKKVKIHWNKVGIGIFLLVLLAVSMYFTRHYDISQDDIRRFIEAQGIWAFAVYVLLLTVLPLVLFPDSVIVIAGGMTFGLAWGTVLTVIGSVAGAVIAFWLARFLGQSFIQKHLRGKLVTFDWGMNGFLLILLLRLIPLFPFKIVSYSAGLSNVKFGDYFLATTLGSLPGILAYVNIGDKSHEIGSGSFYLAIAFLLLLGLISIPGKKFLKRREENHE